MMDHGTLLRTKRSVVAAALATALLAGCSGRGGGSGSLVPSATTRNTSSVAAARPTFTFVANVRMVSGDDEDHRGDSAQRIAQRHHHDDGLPIFVLSEEDRCFGAPPPDGDGGDHHHHDRGDDAAARKTADWGHHHGSRKNVYAPENDTTLRFGAFTLTDPCKPSQDESSSARRTASLDASDGYIVAVDQADPNNPQIVDGPGPFQDYTYTFAASSPQSFLGEHRYTFQLVTAEFPTPSPSPTPTATPTPNPCANFTQSGSLHTMISIKPTPPPTAPPGCPTPTPNPRPTGTATPVATPSPTPTPTPRAGFLTSYTLPAFSLSDTSEYLTAGSPATSVWFTQRSIAGVYRVGLLDSTSGIVTYFTPPHQNLTGIARGTDGAAYYAWHDTGIGVFTSGVDRIDNAGNITSFTYNQKDANGNFDQLYGLRADSNGNLWFSGQTLDHNAATLGNVVGFVVGTVSSAGTFTTFTVPNQPPNGDKISPMADGSLWSFGTDPNDGSIKLYMHVTAGGSVSTSPALDFTKYAAPGPDGNPWFAGHGVIDDVSGGAGSNVPFGGGNVFEIQTAGDGALWWDDLSDRICRLNTATAASDCYVPSQSLAASALNAGPDGILWVLDQTGLSILRVAPSLR